MIIKISKLLIIFIACIPFYTFVDFIFSIIMAEKFTFTMNDALMNSTPFAVSWTALMSYQWVKKDKEFLPFKTLKKKL